MKRFLYYLVWTISIGLIVYLGVKYQIRLREEAKVEFEYLPFYRFTIIFHIFIGLFLCLPKLIIEVIEKKQWTFDWIKFVAIALPSLYIVAVSLLPSFGINLIPVPKIVIVGGTTITTVASIVFGYVLLDCLKK